MIKGFRDFLLRGNVVELAIAVVIGAAFTAIVTSFTENLLTPLIGAIGGEPDFSGITFTINSSEFGIGAFINAVISFLIVAGVVYFFVVVPMNKVMDRMKTEEPVGKPTRDCPQCESSIPTTASRCAFCTAEVGPAPATS